ncbi:hypothetical protein ACLMJK_006423 [Lecanora helva]
MTSHPFSLCGILFFFHLVFGSLLSLVAADAAGKINLYNDYNCNKPSTINPTVALPLSVCLVTTGGEGLVIDELPPCSQGTATMVYYEDTACGVQADISTSIASENCWEIGDGPGLYNAKSVMFSCQPAENHPQPSHTSTAVVSALAAVATGSTGTSGSGSGSESASGGSASTTSSSTPTDSSTPQSGSGSNTDRSSSTNGGTASPGSGSGSGFDTSDIVAIAVGVGIGVPTIAIMLAAWLKPDFRHTLKRWFSSSTRAVLPAAFQPHNPAPPPPYQWPQHSQPSQVFSMHDRFPKQQQFHPLY